VTTKKSNRGKEVEKVMQHFHIIEVKKSVGKCQKEINYSDRELNNGEIKDGKGKS
jgi:hypothetical protein